MAYFSKVYSAQTIGLNASVIDVEADITKGTLHAFSVVGLPDKAVEESRDRFSAAIKNSGFPSPKSQNQKIVISLAPADIKKEGSLFDLPMALTYLRALGKIDFDTQNKLFLGELALDGTIRPIKGTLILVQKARDAGFQEVYLPDDNKEEGALVDGIKIFGVKTLAETIDAINTKREEGGGAQNIVPQPKTKIEYETPSSYLDFSYVKGQDSAKRGLLIAAAGGHNIALYGPPGTGKTLLARAFSGILPELSFDEVLEVTGIHSVSGILGKTLITHPPFRSPHHTSSYISVVGGGTFPKPGEITLAHRGVLFMDEFPEFEKRVLEALRQPLEDRVINISRVKGSETFPADFMLIAAMNPCPCGNFGSEKECTCTQASLQKYKRKLSGPIMDRIDMWVEVGSIDHEKLSQKNEAGGESTHMREKVRGARDIQEKRYGQKATNGQISVRELDSFMELSSECQRILNDAAGKLDLSPRAYHKVIKISRTIADLAGKKDVTPSHLYEALQYRPKEIL